MGSAPSRQEALDAVLAQRARARSGPMAVRVARAAGGFALALVCLPLLVLLPELGVPLLLLALRLLSAEFDWAARAYAWVTWRWGQFRVWFESRSGAVRAVVVLALLAIAAALVWLLVAH